MLKCQLTPEGLLTTTSGGKGSAGNQYLPREQQGKKKCSPEDSAREDSTQRGEEFSHHMSDPADSSDTESHCGAANGGSEEAAERWWAQWPELPGSHRS